RSAGKESVNTVLSRLLPCNDPISGLEVHMKGIAVSQGSACSSGASKPSMVMMMILDDEEMKKTTPLRISFSHLTTIQEIDSLTAALKEIVENQAIKKINV